MTTTTKEQTPKIEIKNLKVHRDMSQETECFSCTVYVDGKKAARVSNNGCGGENEVSVHGCDVEAWAKLEKHVDALPELPLPEDAEEWMAKVYPRKRDVDEFITELLMDAEEAKRFKRLCKKNTLFRAKGETYARGEWRSVNIPTGDPGFANWLAKNYPDGIAEVYQPK